jgi:hypothetical protein
MNRDNSLLSLNWRLIKGVIKNKGERALINAVYFDYLKETM